MNPRNDNSDEPSTAPYGDSAVGRARQLLDDLPETIGPYRILERIGQGGMGEVLRAEQREPIRREVALKLIKLGMDTKLVLARFEAERQALALMDHPHIARVFEAGADEGGRPYFVMEYVRGKMITEYADVNHLSIPERLELFCQVCQAIQHAHHKGIIHRDIKPSNVLVSTQDGKPFAKVIDFGIVKATATQLTERTLYTLHDQFIGTPQYMSPEQAEGSADIDTRTDVYSLGVLLYELLTGTTPFGGAELRDAALDQIKRIIRESDPPKPSTRLSQSGVTLPTLAAARRTEPAKLGMLVRGELDWIVMSAMEKDRRRRYDSPNSLADDVQRHLNGRPVEAAPPSRVYQIAKFAQRNRMPVIVATTLVVLLSGFAAVVSALAVQLKRSAEVAQDANAQLQVALQSEMTAQDDANKARLDAERVRDRVVQLSAIQSADYALKERDLAEAARQIDRADAVGARWEQSLIRGRVATAAIEDFATIQSIPMKDRPRRAVLALPGRRRDATSENIWVTCATDSSIATYAIKDGRQISSVSLSTLGDTPVQQANVLSLTLVGPSEKDAATAVVVLDRAGRLTTFRMPDLKKVATWSHETPAQSCNASPTSSLVAIVHGNNIVSIVDSYTGTSVATKRFADIDKIKRCSISPDGKQVVVAAFSVAYIPKVWEWQSGKTRELSRPTQDFCFLDSKRLYAQFRSSSTGGEEFEVDLPSNEILASRTISSKYAHPAQDSRIGTFRYRNAWRVFNHSADILDIGAFRSGNSRVASELVGSSEPKTYLASSLRPFQGLTAEADLNPQFLACDEQSLAVVLVTDEGLSVLVPRRSLTVPEDRRPRLIDSFGFSAPSELWTGCVEGKSLWSVEANVIYEYSLSEGASRNIDTLRGSFEPSTPERLKGTDQRIVAVAVDDTERTLWALWEGADNFLHNPFQDGTNSKELVVSVYQLPSGRAMRDRRYEPVSLEPDHAYRLVKHPRNGARHIRRFAIADDLTGLLISTDYSTCVYDPKDGQLLNDLGDCEAVDVSADRRMIAVVERQSGEHRRVSVYQFEGSRELQKSVSFKRPVESICLSYSGDKLACATAGEIISLSTARGEGKLTRVKSEGLPRVFPIAEDRAVLFMPRGGMVGDLVLAELSSGRPIMTIKSNVHIKNRVEATRPGSSLLIFDKWNVQVIGIADRHRAMTTVRMTDREALEDWLDMLSSLE